MRRNRKVRRDCKYEYEVYHLDAKGPLSDVSRIMGISGPTLEYAARKNTLVFGEYLVKKKERIDEWNLSLYHLTK